MFEPRKWIIAISLLYTAQAIAQPPEPRYTYLEAGYVDIDLNDVDADGDGFALGGSLALGDAFYLAGSYADYDLNLGIEVFDASFVCCFFFHRVNGVMPVLVPGENSSIGVGCFSGCLFEDF